MHVEVDQSGKIGAKGATVLAYSNDTDRKILIPAEVKRKCIEDLRRQGKTGKVFYLQLFCSALFLLLKDEIDRFSLVTIDPEYQSKSKDIKRFLINLLVRSGKFISTEKIRFKRIGKKSRTHQKALDVLRGRLRADKVVRAEELLGQMKNVER